MNTAPRDTPEQLRVTLFPEDGDRTYAVIDGASCEELLDHLGEHRPEYVCLYAGELAPDVEAVAPYLVTLLPDHPFTEWLLANCFGKHWGIFVRGKDDQRTMRKHFRTFLLVRSPDGVSWYFRFYDPRVIMLYLPTTNEAERRVVFGDLRALYCESPTGDFVEFGQADGELTRRICFAVGLGKKETL